MRSRRCGLGAVAVLAACSWLWFLPAVPAEHDPVGSIEPDRLFAGARFDPAIPTQEAVTGVRHGARPLRPEEVLAYFERLAEVSPRARLFRYAESHEGRPLVYLAIGEEATVARLDEFKREHFARMDPRVTPEETAGFASAKAVAWIAYGIHGDELSSVDAAAAVAYWLVAGEDELAQRMRRELVVLIDPCENPDGRQRFLAQTTSFAHAVPNPDLEDLSHTSVWPWGRGNHYLFDLNRDWFSQVHPESARSGAIASWQPSLVVDSHEMGPDDTYLFSPPRHPFNPHKPAQEGIWAPRFAADQANALDQRGYGYYTREWNEEFFPGYGSSWASYHGAVGILYEMSSTEGTLVKRREGVVRTYPQAVEHQVASSVANLGTLLRHRAEILAGHHRARKEAIDRGRSGKLRAWVFPAGRHPERTRRLADVLTSQGVEAYRLEGEAVRAEGLTDARSGATGPVRLEPGSVMVPLDQPAGRLARVLLDPHVPMDATFLSEEREYLERGKGSRLYDTTAWALPLSYGVEAYWSGARPPGIWTAHPGPAVSAMSVLAGLPAPERGQVYAYAFDGTSDRAAFALAALLQRGLALRVAEKPFTVRGKEFSRGTVLIEREGNPPDVNEQIMEVQRRIPIEVHVVNTAKADAGPDLGGDHFPRLIAPRVGVFTGMPVSPSDYGSLWHLLDHQLRMRFSGLDLIGFNQKDLSRYNVLIFPPSFGGPGSYRHLLGERGVERLKQWIEAGGTAIGIANGARFLADKDLGLTRTRIRAQALDRYPPAVIGIDANLVEAGGRFRAVGVRPAEEEKKEADEDGKKKKRPVAKAPARTSPYDVAPVIGAGARPFLDGTPLGTPVEMKPVALSEWIKPLLAPGSKEATEEDLAAADARLRLFSPQGAYLNVDLDGEHWLNWGVPENRLDALVRNGNALVAEPPVQVAARFADPERLHLGGLLWPEAAGRLARTAYVTRESKGRGQVILFQDHPNFRAWTLGTRRLFLNAVLYGPGLGTYWSRPW